MLSIFFIIFSASGSFFSSANEKTSIDKTRNKMKIVNLVSLLFLKFIYSPPVDY